MFGMSEFDIYTIPVTGGPEKRLTTTPGLDDGPEYSADGQWIYFNSDRTGRMQIWRMRVDGSQTEPVTTDEFNNGFHTRHRTESGWSFCPTKKM